MTAERLEIIAGSGKVLGHVILKSEGQKTIVEGDFLSNGKYNINMGGLKEMIRLKAKKEYGRGFEIISKPINTSYSLQIVDWFRKKFWDHNERLSTHQGKVVR